MTRPAMGEFDQYLAMRRALIETALAAAVPPVEAHPRMLHEAIHYSLFPGGKRVRPILALAATEAVGGAIEPLLGIVVAIELIHAYSLVHDDLPAMDNDEYRRGRPTTHRVYGEGVAILVGDALLTTAFTVLADPRHRDRGIDSDVQLAVIHELGRAIGSQGMVGGQLVDIRSQGQPVAPETLHEIHSRKTGALIRASVRAGAILARAEEAPLRALTVYGEKVGLAFQIADDILDLNGTPEAPGPQRPRATYPSQFGLGPSRTIASALVDEALQAIASLGPRAEPLRWLAHYIVERQQ